MGRAEFQVGKQSLLSPEAFPCQLATNSPPVVESKVSSVPPVINADIIKELKRSLIISKMLLHLKKKKSVIVKF